MSRLHMEREYHDYVVFLKEYEPRALNIASKCFLRLQMHSMVVLASHQSINRSSGKNACIVQKKVMLLPK